jgi:hypothetical protein
MYVKQFSKIEIIFVKVHLFLTWRFFSPNCWTNFVFFSVHWRYILSHKGKLLKNNCFWPHLNLKRHSHAKSLSTKHSPYTVYEPLIVKILILLYNHNYIHCSFRPVFHLYSLMGRLEKTFFELRGTGKAKKCAKKLDTNRRNFSLVQAWHGPDFILRGKAFRHSVYKGTIRKLRC